MELMGIKYGQLADMIICAIDCQFDYSDSVDNLLDHLRKEEYKDCSIGFPVRSD